MVVEGQAELDERQGRVGQDRAVAVVGEPDEEGRAVAQLGFAVEHAQAVVGRGVAVGVGAGVADAADEVEVPLPTDQLHLAEGQAQGDLVADEALGHGRVGGVEVEVGVLVAEGGAGGVGPDAEPGPGDGEVEVGGLRVVAFGGEGGRRRR